MGKTLMSKYKNILTVFISQSELEDFWIYCLWCLRHDDCISFREVRHLIKKECTKYDAKIMMKLDF